MQNGQSIQDVDKCSHLDNELCPTNKNVLPLNAVNDLHCRLNNLLADFSHCDIVIVRLYLFYLEHIV